MKCVSQGEFYFQVISKNGMHYAQVFEVETFNLIFETDALTREGAEIALGQWLIEYLGKQTG